MGRYGVIAAAISLAAAAVPNPKAQAPAVLVGAGDIATCGSTADESTAALLDSIPGTIFTAGDNAYPNGTANNFAECYGASWGRHKARTRPTPGNHDWRSASGGPYFAFFGDRAGTAGAGYYSYDLGGWHVIAVNSNIAMTAGSPQEQWLRADLAANPRRCTLAYWHHPRFSSGDHGSSTAPQALWQALYDAGADVVLNGHDHTYERFALQSPLGVPDTARGIRQFVVGTGGAGLYEFEEIVPTSEVRDNTSHGVLKLTLYPDRYEWEFVTVRRGVRDSGKGTCH